MGSIVVPLGKMQVSRTSVFSYLLLFLLAFVLYGRTIQYPFVWDDERAHLTEHENFMSGNLKEIWTHTKGMYIPVSYSVWYGLKLISATGGSRELKPAVFHFANVLLHGLNSALVFLILILCIKEPAAAFAGAVVFLVHPLQVESVAWVSEFRGLLASLFGFTSMAVYFHELKNQVSLKGLFNSNGYLAASLLFVLAVLSKPSVIVLPLVLPFIVRFIYPEKSIIVLKSVAGWFVFVLLIGLITPGHQSPELSLFSLPAYQSYFVASYSILFYVLKVFIPLSLSPCYGITPVSVIQSVFPYLAGVAMAAGAVFIFKYRNRLNELISGILLLILAVLPVSGIIPFDYQRFSIVADRYVYFGMLGPALMAAYLWKSGKTRPAYRILTGFFILFFTVISIKQTGVWKSEFSLWQRAYQVNPRQWTANYNLGVAYHKKGNYAEAIKHYSKAVEFNPSYRQAWVNMANIYGKLKRYDESLAAYSKAIAIDSLDGSIFYNRALTYYYMGEYDKTLGDLLAARSRGFPVDDDIMSAVARRSQIKKRMN